MSWEIAGALMIFLAGIVRGFAGFGFSALCVASLTFFISPALAVPLIFLMEIAASVWMLPSLWRQIDFSWLRAFMLGLVITTPIGVALLAHLSVAHAQITVYGLLILASLLVFAQGRNWLPAFAVPYWLAGGFSGLANGLATVGGLVAALFLLSSKRDAACIRASLVALFFIGDIYALLWGGGLGLLQAAHFRWLMIFILPLVAGLVLGSFIFRHWGAGNYRPLVVLLIFAVALFGLARL